MIQSKQDLKEYMLADNDFWRPQGTKAKVVADFAQYPSQKLRKYLHYFRKQEYYINTANGNKLKGLIYG